MMKHFLPMLALVALVHCPLAALAQDGVDTASENAVDNVSETQDKTAQDDAKKDDVAKEDSDEDDKGWSIGADLAISLGLGAFVKDEYARKIRSRLTFSVNGSYTIPVIDVDVHAETGFSQWLSKTGGSNSQYEFRWADSEIGFSRSIWTYKKDAFAVAFGADLSFTLPTSTASINMDFYTAISPSLSASVKIGKFSAAYVIKYAHNFHKYTSLTLDPDEVDVLSRSTGEELIGTHDVAVDGVLTEMELLNQFVFAYKFLDCLSLSIGFGFADAWTYDNGTITKDDEFVSPNAKVGRGHSQASMGTIALAYSPIDMLELSLSMVSQQPWKTADNTTIRFPWFDTVSPAKNYTKFMFGVSFSY